MVFQENDFSQELQNSEIMQGQIKEAIKDVQPDVDNCFLDCLKGLNKEQLIKIIEKNYKNPDGSWKKRSEMRPTETTGYAYTTIVQCALKMLGYYTGEISAFYSNDVRAAVRLFQEQNCFNDDNQVKVDDVVGPNTFSLIVEKLGGIAPSVVEKIYMQKDLVDKEGNVNKKNLSLFLQDQLKLDKSNVNKLIRYLQNDSTDSAGLSMTKWIIGKYPIVDAIIFNRATEGMGTTDSVVDELITVSVKNPNHLNGLVSDFKQYFHKDFIQTLLEENQHTGKKKFYLYLDQIAASNKTIVQDWLNKDTQTQRDLLTTINSNTFKNKYPNIEKCTIDNSLIASAE